MLRPILVAEKNNAVNAPLQDLTSTRLSNGIVRKFQCIIMGNAGPRAYDFEPAFSRLFIAESVNVETRQKCFFFISVYMVY